MFWNLGVNVNNDDNEDGDDNDEDDDNDDYNDDFGKYSTSTFKGPAVEVWE